MAGLNFGGCKIAKATFPFSEVKMDDTSKSFNKHTTLSVTAEYTN